MLNVTANDLKNEVDVFRKIKPLFSEFRDFYFIQNKDSAVSEFDFNGYSDLLDGKAVLSSLACRVDVKVRDGIHHNQFPDYIVSKEKVEKSREEKLRHYMIYYFPLDDALYVYCLNDCVLTYDPEYHYFHKREQRDMVKEVYKVVASSFLYRIVGDDISKIEKPDTKSGNTQTCYLDGCDKPSDHTLEWWCCPDHKLEWQKKNYGGRAGSPGRRLTIDEMREALKKMGKSTPEDTQTYLDVVTAFEIDPAAPESPQLSLSQSSSSPTDST